MGKIHSQCGGNTIYYDEGPDWEKKKGRIIINSCSPPEPGHPSSPALKHRTPSFPVLRLHSSLQVPISLVLRPLAPN
jgi:hypothetical protein